MENSFNLSVQFLIDDIMEITGWIRVQIIDGRRDKAIFHGKDIGHHSHPPEAIASPVIDLIELTESEETGFEKPL